MSTLTKVFVVLLVVFSIAFTSMTVSMVAQSTNWKDTAAKYEENARIADTNLRHQIAAGAALLAAARDEAQVHLRTIRDLEGRRDAVKTRMSQLQSQLAKVEAEKSNAEAMNRALLAQLDVAEAARGEYRKQRDDLEHDHVEIERRNIDLNDRVNELTVRVDVLLEQKRQYEQQVNMLRSENERLSRTARGGASALAFESPEGASLPGTVALSPVAATVVRGKVMEVSGNLVTVSVGSADGVKKNMLFVIHRDGEYVGDLKVTLIDPNQSAGQLVRSTSTPTAGDEVTDATSLTRSRG